MLNAWHLEILPFITIMDIDELIIATLQIAEEKEIMSQHAPAFYTCQIRADNLFSEIVATGELCVCASSMAVASLVFFLLEGVFDHGDNRQKWYTGQLHKCAESLVDFDGELTAEIAYKVWTSTFHGQLTEHKMSQPILVHHLPGNVLSLTPSTCDIWTLPRIRRQFVDT
jgi:hypothetical protein